MNSTNSFLIILIATVLLAPGTSLVYAHVPFGEYAGTHAVAMVPQPRSPLVGETVKITFYMRDLHGDFPEELHAVTALIHELLPDDSERKVFTTTPKTISNGIYETSYAFTRPGNYRVEFDFGKPGEPEIIRDANFGIEVRDLPQGTPNTLWIAVLLLITVLAFAGGFIIAKRRARYQN